MNITDPFRPPRAEPEAATLDVDAQTEAQKTALLYRSSSLTLLASPLVALVMAAVNVHLHTSGPVGFAWWALICLITLARMILNARYRRAVASRGDAPWRRRFLAGVAAAGLAWGAGAALFAWHAPDAARLFTGLVLAGMVAGAVSSLSSVPLAFQSFALPVLIPTSAIVLWQAQSLVDAAFGLLTALFLLIVAGSARRLHGSLDMAIRLGVEQKRLAQRSRESVERYRLILQYSPAGIFHYDRQLHITFCNSRLEHILQAERERLIGLDLRQLADQRLIPALQAALDGRDGIYEGEYLSTIAGLRLWVSMACTPYRDGEGHIAGGIAILQDVTDRRKTQEEIRQLAYFDPLTRLPNRRLLMDRLGRAMAGSAPYGRHGALMILDVDRFKQINDSQGHDIGDSMLVEAARRLAACVGRDDTVARFGGDEFVVIVEALEADEDAAAARAEALAERLRAALETPYELGGSEAAYYSSASVGLTLFRGESTSGELLLKQADVALYQAKESGRNTVRFFNPAMQARIEHRAALEGALRRGLEQGEFRLHFQPQVDAFGRTVAAEALIRWQPAGGLLQMPEQFIGLAEETGLILPIGRWVLERACAQLRAWESNPRLRHLRLSVNVNARQFHEPGFVEQVRQALLASGANPALLTLELTESVVLSDVDAVVARMQHLIRLGVGFALDDFGQGYSSLSYLKRLPLRQVKIDRAFISGLPHDQGDAAIVRAVLAMSEALGLQPIAEGVEARAQQQFLAQHGCRTYQGFLFCRPVPLAEFERFVAAAAPEPVAATHDDALPLQAAHG